MSVGFDWDRSDERELQNTFGVGCDDLFSHFIDAKKQAEVMGYQQFGLNSLARLMFDFEVAHPNNVQFFSITLRAFCDT